MTEENEEECCNVCSTGQFDWKVDDIFQQLKNNRDHQKRMREKHNKKGF